MNDKYLLFSVCIVCMISVFMNCETQLDGKNPHWTKLQISEWSTFARRVKLPSIKHTEILTRSWSNMYRSEIAFCSKIFSLWPGDGSWNASFQISIVSTIWEWSFVKCHDWPLLWIEYNLDNLRCTSNNMKCILSRDILYQSYNAKVP